MYAYDNDIRISTIWYGILIFVTSIRWIAFHVAGMRTMNVGYNSYSHVILIIPMRETEFTNQISCTSFIKITQFTTRLLISVHDSCVICSTPLRVRKKHSAFKSPVQFRTVIANGISHGTWCNHYKLYSFCFCEMQPMCVHVFVCVLVALCEVRISAADWESDWHVFGSCQFHLSRWMRIRIIVLSKCSIDVVRNRNIQQIEPRNKNNWININSHVFRSYEYWFGVSNICKLPAYRSHEEYATTLLVQ